MQRRRQPHVRRRAHGDDGVGDGREAGRWATRSCSRSSAIKLQNVDVKTDKSDVQVKLAVDDQSLRALLANVPSLMGQ